MRFQFRSPTAHRCPLTQLHYIANFKVKNDGHVPLIVTLPPVIVEVPPGETSQPFTRDGTYIIRPKNHAALPEPSEIIVKFSPKKEIEAKSNGKHPIDAEIIAKFD